MKLTVKPISEFNSTKDIINYLKVKEKEDGDILLCFNHGVLAVNPLKNGGHVCVFDRLKNGQIRMIDPSHDWPKWRIVSCKKMYEAMKKHSGNTGGFWEINVFK